MLTKAMAFCIVSPFGCLESAPSGGLAGIQKAMHTSYCYSLSCTLLKDGAGCTRGPMSISAISDAFHMSTRASYVGLNQTQTQGCGPAYQGVMTP